MVRAILSYYNGHISLEENSSTVYSSNAAVKDGGAIFSHYSNISFHENSTIVQYSRIILLTDMVELYTLGMVMYLLNGILLHHWYMAGFG